MSGHLHLATRAAPSSDSAGDSEPVKVLVADDHHVVRHGLRVLLDNERGVEVVGEAADIGEVLRKVFALIPNVLALDLRLPGCSVCETIRRLRAELPETEIVVLTMHESGEIARRVLDAGAIGVVLKDRADSELPSAIRSAADAQEYVSGRVAGCAEALRKTSYEASSSTSGRTSAYPRPVGSLARTVVPSAPDASSSVPPAR